MTFTSLALREGDMRSGATCFFDKARDYNRVNRVLEELAARRERNSNWADASARQCPALLFELFGAPLS